MGVFEIRRRRGGSTDINHYYVKHTRLMAPLVQGNRPRVFYAGLFYYLKLFSHFVALSTVWRPFRSLPNLIVAPGQDGCRSLAVLPRPLPPDVAKRMIVLPEKSWLSKKVLMIDGAVYHQIGSRDKWYRRG